MDFHEGLAVTWSIEAHKAHTRVIDVHDNVVLDLQEGSAFAFYEGVMAYSKGSLFSPSTDEEETWIGFMDKNGKTVIQPQFTWKFDEVEPFFQEGAALVTLNNRLLFMNKQGSPLFPNQHFADAQPYSEGLAAVMNEDYSWGFIDKKGQYLIKPAYEDAGPFNEGLAQVEVNGKWGFVNAKGKLVIPAKFDRTDVFSEGLATACTGTGKGTGTGKDKKCGIIDKTGKFAVKPQFYNVDPFQNGLAAVYFDNSYDNNGYINKQGAIIWKAAK